MIRRRTGASSAAMLLAAVSAFVSLAPPVALSADGQAIYERGGAQPAALACGTCHGPQALGMAAAGFPRLAGLSPGYAVKQMQDFKSGARNSPIMQPIALALSEPEVKAVAEFLAQMPAPPARMVQRVEKAEGVGERLALRGAWERSIPECVSCHGPGGVGVGDHFPSLSGQPASYTTAQLNAWRAGTRSNDPDDLMGHIARSMTDAEVTAVSEYFAGLSGKEATQ